MLVSIFFCYSLFVPLNSKFRYSFFSFYFLNLCKKSLNHDPCLYLISFDFLEIYFLTSNKFDFIYVIKVMISILELDFFFFDEFIVKGPSTPEILWNISSVQEKRIMRVYSVLVFIFFADILKQFSCCSSIIKTSLFKYTFIQWLVDWSHSYILQTLSDLSICEQDAKNYFYSDKAKRVPNPEKFTVL